MSARHRYLGDQPHHVILGSDRSDLRTLTFEGSIGAGAVRRRNRLSGWEQSLWWRDAFQEVFYLDDDIAPQVHAALDFFLKQRRLLISEREPYEDQGGAPLCELNLVEGDEQSPTSPLVSEAADGA